MKVTLRGSASGGLGTPRLAPLDVLLPLLHNCGLGWGAPSGITRPAPPACCGICCGILTCTAAGGDLGSSRGLAISSLATAGLVLEDAIVSSGNSTVLDLLALAGLEEKLLVPSGYGTPSLLWLRRVF